MAYGQARNPAQTPQTVGTPNRMECWRIAKGADIMNGIRVSRRIGPVIPIGRRMERYTHPAHAICPPLPWPWHVAPRLCPAPHSNGRGIFTHGLQLTATITPTRSRVLLALCRMRVIRTAIVRQGAGLRHCQRPATDSGRQCLNSHGIPVRSYHPDPDLDGGVK